MADLKNIFDECGLTVHRSERVHGGDINEAYCLFTPSGKFFLKINDNNRYPAMLEKEASGLNILRKYFALAIPSVIKQGVSDRQQYLLLEWLEKGNPTEKFWEDFGAALANMHKSPQTYFGFHEDNYIGSLRQLNRRRDRWSSFYAENRIMPLVRTLFDKSSFSSKDVNNANEFCKRLDEVFPTEMPALVHGDLWAGNYLISSSGDAAIFDPAVYFGHREMDIGMTRLFGGFDRRFYEAYDSVYPLKKDWEKRLIVSQLYPILVHAVLFNGHYIGQARDIIQRLY